MFLSHTKSELNLQTYLVEKTKTFRLILFYPNQCELCVKLLNAANHFPKDTRCVLQIDFLRGGILTPNDQ